MANFQAADLGETSDLSDPRLLDDAGSVAGLGPAADEELQRRAAVARARARMMGIPRAAFAGEVAPTAGPGRPMTAQPAGAQPGELAAAGGAPRPALARYEGFEAQPAPTYQQPKKIAGWKSALGTVGSLAAGMFAPAAGELLYQHATNAGRQTAAHRQFAQALEDRAAQEGELLKAAQAENAAIPKPKATDYKFENIGGHLWSLDASTGEKVSDLGPAGTAEKVREVTTDDQGNAVAVFDDGSTKQLGYKPQAKPKTFTNPFEAFTYGSPDERQAAQDFVNTERRAGARYRNPTEIEERYRLYKSDPAAYGAMFGQKGGPGGISQATATRMLNYFDKRRREIAGDFTLDDQTKAQQLASIDQLEQPFMDAARGQGGANAGGDTITVINKRGVLGTIPVGNLKAALKQGYRLAPQQ